VSKSFSSSPKVEDYVRSISWEKRLASEIPFITKIFRERGYREIVDLGCGPGRHAKALSEMGFSVTGIDSQSSMAEFALKEAKRSESLQYRVGNFMTNPEILGKERDAIYSIGNTLMIIWSDESTEAPDLFRGLSGALRPGGALFFQVLNSDSPRSGYVVSNISKDETGLQRISIKHFLPINEWLHTHFLTLKWYDSSQVTKEESEPGYLRLLPVSELEKLMVNAGFSEFHFWEDYQGGNFNPQTSDSLLCVAIKPV